jgi:hypothetical protein
MAKNLPGLPKPFGVVPKGLAITAKGFAVTAKGLEMGVKQLDGPLKLNISIWKLKALRSFR